jgi:hypothetical protein
VIWVSSLTQTKSSIYRISILRLYLLILQQNLRFRLEHSHWSKIPLHTSIPISSKTHWVISPLPLNSRPSSHFPRIFPTSITIHSRMADTQRLRRLPPHSRVCSLPFQQLQMTWRQQTRAQLSLQAHTHPQLAQRSHLPVEWVVAGPTTPGNALLLHQHKVQPR